jgi:multiple sugar transport system substrate-binding protein
MKRTQYLPLVGLVAVALALLAACGGEPEQVEVTRIVERTTTEEVEVTRLIEQVSEVEVTRVVEVESAMAGGFPAGTELRILQWSHFVPQYDTWIGPFARAWGDANGVAVTMDHVNLADLNPSLAAALDAGQGPHLVELPLAAANFVEGIHDLTALNMRAQELFGPQAETCTANSYLPAIDKWYGYCHGWVPDPGDYDMALWTAAGFPEGPSTWDELLEGGSFIRDELGVPMGLGLSPEIDSNMALRGIIWSFGASIQDADECVTVNTPEMLEAVQYTVELYNRTMTEEVFSWDAASNNQGLIAGELSYILNSISAYRSLQKIDPEAADNIGFVEALRGPRGDQHASAHLWYIYVIPNYVPEGSPEFQAAEEFMLHLTANYNQAVFNSELYNFPAFESTVPQLEGWLANDPFGSRPPDKLMTLLTARDWVTYLGWPGPSNPAVSEIYATNIVPTIFGQAALGQLTPEQAVDELEAQVTDIFEKWRARGLVGCAG